MSKSIQTVAKGKLIMQAKWSIALIVAAVALFALSVPAHASKMDDQNYIIR